MAGGAAFFHPRPGASVEDILEKRPATPAVRPARATAGGASALPLRAIDE